MKNKDLGFDRTLKDRFYVLHTNETIDKIPALYERPARSVESKIGNQNRKFPGQEVLYDLHLFRKGRKHGHVPGRQLYWRR